jgi:hypothetical protein
LPEHRAALIAERRAARDLKGRDRLRAVAPGIDRLLERWALGGRSLAIRVTRTIKLLDLYATPSSRPPSPTSWRATSPTSARSRWPARSTARTAGGPVPVALLLPAHLDDADVVPHDLETYDE